MTVTGVVIVQFPEEAGIGSLFGSFGIVLTIGTVMAASTWEGVLTALTVACPPPIRITSPAVVLPKTGAEALKSTFCDTNGTKFAPAPVGSLMITKVLGEECWPYATIVK